MFYHSIWDPGLIISQILLLQCVFYFSLGFWLILFQFFFHSNALLFQLFSDSALNLSSFTHSLPTFLSFLLTLPLISYCVFLVVGRAKKCLDFCFTLYALHFLLCRVSENAWPTKWEYWLFHILSLIVITLASEFLCIQQELKWIPLGESSNATNKEKEREKIKTRNNEEESESVSLLAGNNRRILQSRELQLTPPANSRGFYAV
jgi:hypothetical protein